MFVVGLFVFVEGRVWRRTRFLRRENVIEDKDEDEDEGEKCWLSAVAPPGYGLGEPTGNFIILIYVWEL